MKSRLIIFILFVVNTFVFAQSIKNESWTRNEIANYQKLKELANYVYGKKESEISQDTLFEKYIYFDYVLNDTEVLRRKERLTKFGELFSLFKSTVDSIGLENLDAKPIRFYKGHKIYRTFDEEYATKSIAGENMNTNPTNVLVYYKKGNPEEPLGPLLFEPDSNRLVAWIYLLQGEKFGFFLTFSLF